MTECKTNLSMQSLDSKMPGAGIQTAPQLFNSYSANNTEVALNPIKHVSSEGTN